jgi:hypothetical protein
LDDEQQWIKDEWEQRMHEKYDGKDTRIQLVDVSLVFLRVLSKSCFKFEM